MNIDAPYRHAPIERPEMREMRRLSDAPGIARLSAHLAVLAIAGLLISVAPGPIWRLPAQALEGAFLVFLFAPLHESIHRTAFRNRRLNDAVAAVIGFLLLLPAVYFRFFHFAHHRYTQDPALDPELATPKPRTFPQWALAASGLPLWRDLALALLRHAAGRTSERYLSPIAARRVVREARISLTLYVVVAIISLASRSTIALDYWIIPALLGQPWLRLFLMAEHTGCPLVPDMLANSRCTRSNGLVRFFAWNMPYHAEHHTFPAVPFHALPRLHRRLAGELRVVASGYIAVQREILKSFA